MYSKETGQSIIINLNNTAYAGFDHLSKYLNIISPFSRIYFIEKGEGEIIIAGVRTKLEEGYLYLVPSFTPCTYIFEKGLVHYYIHFSITMNNGLSPYNLYTTKTKVYATGLDKILFKRLVEIVPDLRLPHHDPHVYQKKPWVNKKTNYSTINQHIESASIIGQLFSRFLDVEQEIHATSVLRYNIQQILVYIQSNIQSDVSIKKLASMAFLSKDHFSRIFKSIIGMTPTEFILKKRIEEAQLLLLTTDLTMEQIMEETNFKSPSYFSRTFKKYNSIPPGQYRKQRG